MTEKQIQLGKATQFCFASARNIYALQAWDQLQQNHMTTVIVLYAPDVVNTRFGIDETPRFSTLQHFVRTGDVMIFGCFEILKENTDAVCYVWNVCKNPSSKFYQSYKYMSIILFEGIRRYIREVFNAATHRSCVKISLNVDLESETYDRAVKSYLQNGFYFSSSQPLGIPAHISNSRNRIQRMDLHIPDVNTNRKNVFKE